MKRAGPIFFIGFLLVMTFSPTQAVFADNAELAPKVDLSEDELKSLIRLFEDEKEREAFVERLKLMAQLQAAQKRIPDQTAPTGSTRIMFRQYNRLGAWIQKVITTTLGLIQQIPRIPHTAKSVYQFLIVPANQTQLFRFVIGISIGLIPALMVYFALRRFMPGMPPPKRPVLWSFIFGLIQACVACLPSFALFLTGIIVLPILKVHPLVIELTANVLLIVVGYQFLVNVAKIFLAPNDPAVRLLPLGDETANYLWVWFGRLAKYTAFYFFMTTLLAPFPLKPDVRHLLRGVLLIIYPILLTIFIFQIRRDIKNSVVWSKQDQAVSTNDGSDQSKDIQPLPGFRKILIFILRLLWLPALVYVWVIFLLLITQYTHGFAYLLSASRGSLLTILVFSILTFGMNRGFHMLFSISKKISDRFPEMEAKANRYLQIVYGILQGLIGAIGLLVLAQVWGAPVAKLVTSSIGALIIGRAMVLALTLGIMFIILETSHMIANWLLQEKEGVSISQQRKTLVPLIKTTLVVATLFVGGIIILDQLGINIKPILAGAGIIGLGVGLGAQSLVKDLINGMFILLQNMISVGDVVMLGDQGGVVESVGLRTLQLRDLSGNVHIIPNSTIERVINMTKGYSRYVFDVGVAYREDVDEVIAILKELGQEMQADEVFGPDILEPIEILGLDRFDDSAIVIRARFKTKPIRQWAIGREFNRRMKKRFDERGIEIPFPHQTVYQGEPKKGAAAPLHVQIDPEDQPAGSTGWIKKGHMEKREKIGD